MPATLTIEYPELLPHQLRQSREEFERDARLALAVKLFEMKRVSSGVAASIAGVERVEFLLELHRFGVPAVDLSADEIRRDLEHA